MSQPFTPIPNRPTQLKICGITTKPDALKLIELGVDALGFNFWPKSKRYITPSAAAAISAEIKGKILRVGVFVNEAQENIIKLLAEDIIDVAQLHGDEDICYCQRFAQAGYPFIKAIGVASADSLERLTDYQADAILLDAHAPDVYGGTGDTFDWNLANKVIAEHPELPIILAGGITSANAADATQAVRPHALDVASGAEISPGIKDFNKVAAIQTGIISAS